MNFGEIKAFMGDKSQVNPNDAIKNQLREAGLKQAETGISMSAESTVSKLSSQTTVGLRIYNNSLNQTLQIDDNRANLKTPEETNKSLFDFEEVAKNVLRFVGGVISGAARSGADQEALTSLFEQARSGVAQGIKLAEKDLSGFLNDEISEGIDSSAALIEQGIQQLQDRLLGDSQPVVDPNAAQITTLASERIAASSQQNGELQIRTRDGDEVIIRFEDLKQFELNRQVLQQQEKQPKQNQGSDVESNDVLPRTGVDKELDPQAETNQTATANNEATENETSVTQVESQQSVFIAQNSYSFSVTGDLDEAELESIGQLVSDANDLATTFFEGDVEAAFNQALELGFDESELTGFALQLTRQEQVEVVKTYESVSHYKDDSAEKEQTSKPIERVSDYLQKMLNVFEQSQQKLAAGDQYETLINGIINEVQELGTTDLVSAINDFHAFNKQLLSNLPNSNEQAE